MLDIFPRPEKWDLLNNRIKKHLKSEFVLRAYENPYLAVYDLVIALAQLYSHKRSIAWIKGQSPLFDSVYPYFVREGYQIQSYTLEELEIVNKDSNQFVESLKKDTLFFLYIEDNPLTGELFKYNELENALSHKKIFSIAISHHSFFCKPESFYPLSSRICYYDSDLTLITFGDKFKVNPILGQYQNLLDLARTSDNNSLQLEDKLNLFSQKNFFKNEIQDFEKNFLTNSVIKSDHRIWDRSLLHFDEVHSSELVSRLNDQGFKNIFSLSSCDTQSIKMFHRWFQPEMLNQKLSSYVLFKFNNKTDFPDPKLVKKIIDDIVTESQWEF